MPAYFCHATYIFNHLLFDVKVLSQKGKYKGQKLMKLVSTKIPARIIKTNPKVPVMTLVK
jgi:hypothetical protein